MCIFTLTIKSIIRSGILTLTVNLTSHFIALFRNIDVIHYLNQAVVCVFTNIGVYRHLNQSEHIVFRDINTIRHLKYLTCYLFRNADVTHFEEF